MLLSTHDVEQVHLSSFDVAVNHFPLTVPPNTLLMNAIALMSQHEVGYVLVVEDSNILGYLSAKNLARIITYQVNLETTQIREVMTNCLTVCDSGINLSLLQHHELTSVVDNQGNLQGIITSETVCQALESGDKETNNKTNNNISHQQLEVSPLCYHQIVENTIDAVLILDLNGQVIYQNPILMPRFGYSIEEMNTMGGPLAIFYSYEDKHEVCSSIENQQDWQGKVEIVCRGGRRTCVHLYTNFIKDEQNETIAITITYRDIRYQNYIEENLRLRDRALDATTNGVIIIDTRQPSQPITYVNHGFEKITGYLASEVLGRNSDFLQKADNNQPVLAELQQAFSTHKCCTVLLRNYRKDGVLFWNEFSISPVFNHKHRLTHYVGILNDVSDRKQGEVAIRVSKARLQYLLFSTPGTVYTSRVSGDFGPTFVSENVVNMIGYSSKEFTQNPDFWINHIHPEDQANAFESMSQVPFKGQKISEYRFLHRDGKYRWLLDSSRVLYDETGNSLEVIGFCLDITERKQLEEDLRTALAKEKELNELKSRFISMTSHEFRTPLSTILSSSELLEHYRHNWTQEKELLHLHRIQATVKHMTQLLNDVLLIGKAEAGKSECEPTFLDLVEFCHEIVTEMLLSSRNTHKIAFHSSQESISGFMDQKLLRHIFTNLLSNAIKYSPTDSTVTFTLAANDTEANFEIQDQGIGIPTDDLSRLFESFHRATNVGNIQGTGLGLSIVKNCVDTHQGNISVNSKLGIGTTFTVTLPLALNIQN